LYFFSAVFQGNMSLLALVAVFLVYKLQHISSNIQTNAEAILSYAKNHFAANPSIYNSLEIRIASHDPEIINEKIQYLSKEAINGNVKISAKQLLDEPNFIDLFSTRKILLSNQSDYRKEFRKPFILQLAVIVLSLFGMVFIYPLHQNYPFIEIIFITITIGLNLITLFVNYKFINQLLVK